METILYLIFFRKAFLLKLKFLLVRLLCIFTETMSGCFKEIFKFFLFDICSDDFSANMNSDGQSNN